MLAGGALGFDGTNNRGDGLGPKMSKRMGDLGFGRMKVDLWNWIFAWLGWGLMKGARQNGRCEDPMIH